jgi:hypothetical protein
MDPGALGFLTFISHIVGSFGLCYFVPVGLHHALSSSYRESHGGIGGSVIMGALASGLILSAPIIVPAVVGILSAL